MKNFRIAALAVIGVVAVTGCTFNIQPSVPSIVAPASGRAASAPCTAILLVPANFREKEYISSFNDRQITIALGAPTSAAIYNLLKSRYASVTKVPVAGDGAVDFMRKASSAPARTLIFRPRFVQTSSSVRAFRYDVTFAVALDAAGTNVSTSTDGRGTGRAGIYTKSALQSAVNTALANAITDLAQHFRPVCPSAAPQPSTEQ